LDANDLTQEWISPNSFLKLGNVNSTLSFGGVDGEQLVQPTRLNLINALQVREEAIEKFKDFWYGEYLLSLRDRIIIYINPIGKIALSWVTVLISSPVKPRPLWSMGRVTKLFTGADGRTRSVELIRPDRSTGEYAISLLYPLELSLDNVTSLTTADVSSAGVMPPSRQRRKAAEKCLISLRNQ
jgi:hypothetical protein